MFSNPVAELPIEEPLEPGNRNRTRAIGRQRHAPRSSLQCSGGVLRLGASGHSTDALSPPADGFLVSSDALEASLLSVKYPFARSCSSLGARSPALPRRTYGHR